MDDSIRKLIFTAIDGTISPEDFERLQDAIERSEEVRDEYLRAVSLCEDLAEIAGDQPVTDALSETQSPVRRPTSRNFRPDLFRLNPVHLAVAFMLLVTVGGVAYWFGQRHSVVPASPVAGSESRGEVPREAVIAGHATLRRSVDLKWSEGTTTWREGDVLPDGMLNFDEGVAEFDFFCGATLIVEGPASLNIESDWSVQVIEGRLRANVPPAARGFVVRAPGADIVDLGTEFALEVGDGDARVEVLDGEVELRGGEHDGQLLRTGEKQSLTDSGRPPQAIEGLSTIGELLRRRDDAEAERLSQWKVFAEHLARDRRLIAYYPMALASEGRIVRNAAGTGAERNGHIVGPVQQVPGRFGTASTGFDFERPGARVRTRIDGEFEAFTFVCWVRIDSLEHRYNALLMGDGYENGEPHWQIRDDGRLMFSVMVDDSKEVRHFSRLEQRVVTDAGLHRVYYTEPFWDITQSGQWFHLAAVYDPEGRTVAQYVNGREISRHEIADRFHTSTLRIGPAEIGNWGQPFRKTPEFAVRNLNGTIDELAIFGTPLDADEIASLYNEGRPLGY
ncbi:FecR protein [Maioricimonas rarisocia]|uniref:FecR protein n=1 Tax=Maioricimonas rarisocia TaxID=2528026 RepID=A0A517ZAQ4_9PLAN|nr:LamG-like jellyroll fold domain-containing protein [Maioricimonas rarisocia]QDU39509.1 FecR protein [Maioricimonas rarisocia]